LENIGLAPDLRTPDDEPDRPWVTDNGGVILDCTTGPIADPSQLAAAVKAISGVVEHGLFLGIAGAALQVDPDGQVVRRDRPAR
jgi:ribose 5-phosphate isomerase A